MSTPATRSSSKRPREDDETEASRPRHRSVVDDALANLVCSITHELPIDPVTADDGQIYERAAIEKWLKQRHTSPVTNLTMGSKLLPAPQVKSMIEAMVRSGAVTGEIGSAWRTLIDDEKKLVVLKQKAEGGDVEAMREVGRCYHEGLMGQAKDADKAFHWYELSAKRGNVRALGGLAKCYMHGIGVAQDVMKGWAMRVESATRGNAFACNALGHYYFVGAKKIGVTKDVQQARRWYEKSTKCDNFEWLDDSNKARVHERLSQCPASEWD